MSPHTAVDIAREALLMATIIAAPVLLTGMVVGFVVGLLQGLTQIHEQSISFVSKLLAMALVIALIFPWALDRLIQYSQTLISGIPGAM